MKEKREWIIAKFHFHLHIQKKKTFSFKSEALQNITFVSGYKMRRALWMVYVVGGKLSLARSVLSVDGSLEEGKGRRRKT